MLSFMPHFESGHFFFSFMRDAPIRRAAAGKSLGLGVGESVLMAMGQAMSGLWFYCLATDLYLLYVLLVLPSKNGRRNEARPLLINPVIT